MAAEYPGNTELTLNTPSLSPRRVISNLRWWIAAVLFASTIINYLDRQTLSLLAPFLKVQYHWSNADYASIVTDDLYQMGKQAADALAKSIGGKGKVGYIFHDATYYVTNQRDQAFKSTIEKDYPNIKIVAEQGIGGPDFSGDAEKAAGAILTEHPKINAIWAVWDVPAEGVMAAARAAGRDDLTVVCEDLGENVAIAMAKKEFIKGIASQRPYDQGVTEAKLAAYALIGKPAPAYVALPAAPITRDTLLAAWQEIYHQPAPDKVAKSMK